MIAGCGIPYFPTFFLPGLLAAAVDVISWLSSVEKKQQRSSVFCSRNLFQFPSPCQKDPRESTVVVTVGSFAL